MKPSSIFIVVPAFNEEKVLCQTVNELVRGGYSVVVVDDGSLVQQQQYICHLPVHILQHEINLGQGAALQTGTEYALQQGAEYIIHFDADGQHTAADLPKLLKPLLRNECDIVLGSRFLNNSGSTVPLIKKMLIHTARYFHGFFTGVWLTDAHNGLRAMNKKAASLVTITENGMSHASELLFLIKQHKLKVQEVAVTVVYTSYSLKKGQTSWNSIRIGFDLLLHKLFP